ncbi:sacsin N-terminal ATP-binding-like domain-containing protein [Mesorhizobium sp. ASY16-5R]|uniref:sacsin N-terminal ATP-binding-like domain-containing protein n=1 Tax=Mesorhizobium sp. ASY16-5R TaxID=3445772 RepID=UPI003F9F9AD8
MAGYSVNARSVILSIQNNLVDRYKTTFDILKELVQNADDAGASKLVVDLRPGVANAFNPLLRGAGLLIVNDGRFTKENEAGIRHVSASSKTDEMGSAGRFGLGQKSLFHLCDAFIVVPSGYATDLRPFIINPYFALFEEAKGKAASDETWHATAQWERIEPEVSALRGLVDTAAFPKAHLAFWLPLRRRDLFPAAKAGFTQKRFDTADDRNELLNEFCQADALAELVAAARSLEHIAIRLDGRDVIAVQRSGEHMRLLPKRGEEAADGERLFGGMVSVSENGTQRKSGFAAAELLSHHSDLVGIQTADDWPVTLDLFSNRVPEKALPHGAAFLIRNAGHRSRLAIHNGVFLPTGISHEIDLAGAANGDSVAPLDLALFLHGYFFVDSGRKNLQGLEGDASDRQSVPVLWNCTLRDRLVLPILPRLFSQALEQRLVSSDEMARLVCGLAQSSWFRQMHRVAVCWRDAWAQTWGAGSLSWRILPADAKVRPLPSSLLESAKDVTDLFPGLEAFAEGRHIVLCAADARGSARVLAPLDPVWPTDELAELLTLIPARAFKRARAARLLRDLLECVSPTGMPIEAVGAVLRRKLREAMQLEENFAPAEVMRGIINHIPDAGLVFLPEKARHSEILSALARAPVDALVVGDDWIEGGVRSLLADSSHLPELLRALEPIAAQEREPIRAEQAARAAMSLVAAARTSLSSLSRDAACRSIRVFPVTRQPDGTRLALSIADLAESAKRKTIFLATPTTNMNVKAVCDALPELVLNIAMSNDAELFRSIPGTEAESGNLEASHIVALVNTEMRFGEVEQRKTLLSKLKKAWSDDDRFRDAVRRLVVGVAEAGNPSTRLYHKIPQGLEDFVERLLRKDGSAFVAPQTILEDFTERDKATIGLSAMDPPELARRIEAALAAGSFDVNAAEGEALLEAELSDTLLRRLPIHQLEGGALVALDPGTCLASQRAVPQALRPFLRRVRKAHSEKARLVQERLMPAHDAAVELNAAVRALEEHTVNDALRDCILAALADLAENREMDSQVRDRLAKSAWLAVGGRNVAPTDILSLPEDVGGPARALLGRGEDLAFHPTASLLPAIREHRGFGRLTRDLLPSLHESFAALAVQIEERGLVGLPFPYNGQMLPDLARLAGSGVDLGLVGWPLMAALLRDDTVAALSEPCLAGLARANSVDQLITTMSVLAETTKLGGGDGEAARRLYDIAFQQATILGDSERQRLFANVDVRTRGGSWRRGSKVAQNGAGLDTECLLDERLADLLSKQQVSATHNDTAPAGSRPAEIALQTGDDLDARSAKDFASFLGGLRGRIESDLALTVLALVGRFAAMRDVMDEWRAGATLETQLHIDKVDALISSRLAQEIDERRFLIEVIETRSVRVTALSGAAFEASLGGQPELLVTEEHKKRRRVVLPNGRRVDLFVLQLRPSVLNTASTHEVTQRLRQLVSDIAQDCMGFILSSQEESLNKLPGMSGEAAQALIEHTQAALREHLPTLLGQLKSKGQPVLRSLVDEHEREAERRRSLQKENSASRADAEWKLWHGLISNPEAQKALLDRVRVRVGEFGYDSKRVVLELFQNADDAYLELDASPILRTFRLESDDFRFEAIHWGRPINDRGPNREIGERKNWHRDLQNMLMMHFSDKPGGDETSGKYGLGFKSVHVLSSDVKIASGLLAARVVGGMLPQVWPEGPGLVTRHPTSDRHAATVISVPYDDDKIGEGQSAVRHFSALAPYLPLFAKAIRRVELETAKVSRSFWRADADDAPPVLPGLRLARIDGSNAYRALLVDLDEGFTLAIKLGETGVVPFAADVPRIWCVAPLAEDSGAGWLLNGPFSLSSNRSSLADDPDRLKNLFQRLGKALGRQLIKLHAAAAADWQGFAPALGIDPADASLLNFFAGLWNLFREDLNDELANHLHGRDRGLGALADSAAVVPSNLPEPFRKMLRASDAKAVFAGALVDEDLRRSVSSWVSTVFSDGEIVSHETANDLEKLGFARPVQFTMERLLKDELQSVHYRVEPATAFRLGTELTPSALSKPPLQLEGAQLRRLGGHATFLSRNGTWRGARELTTPQQEGRKGDAIRAAFAPPERVLSEQYRDAAVSFVLLASADAGYNVGGELMRDWATKATTSAAQEGVLRFLVEEDEKEDFLNALLSDTPRWMRPLTSLADGPLTRTWKDEDRNKLHSKLTAYARTPVPDHLRSGAEEPVAITKAQATEALENIWDWWANNRDELILEYDRHVYPSGFAVAAVPPATSTEECPDRERWFGLLALACFQNFGGTQNGQHRTFVEDGIRNGWWAELAQSEPPQDHEAWIARLREWSSSELPDLQHWRWRRALIDLYKVARWLPQYAWIITKLPRAAAAAPKGQIKLSDVLTPSFSPLWREAGVDAAPLIRTLGLGANWMLRELSRNKFWTDSDVAAIAPYTWASTGRARGLLNKLGAGLGDVGSMDLSRAIWEFVSDRLSNRRNELVLDGDLPLQIIATMRRRSDLDNCLYGVANLDGPWTDWEDETEEAEAGAE